MEKILGLSFLGFICFYLVYLIDEDLNKKFVNIGVFNYNTYNDFVNKIRLPNQIAHQDDFIIAQWCTSNNFFRQNYSVILIFTKDGKFVSKHKETFFQGTPPSIWVGVRI